jgi:catalase
MSKGRVLATIRLEWVRAANAIRTTGESPLKKPPAKRKSKKAATAKATSPKRSSAAVDDRKDTALQPFRAGPQVALTTNQGVPIADNENSLRAGDRGPTLLEDFILREKITHFDHERIPERVVHARGAAAHGYFQVYEPLTDLTRAAFLQDPNVRTPVFARFSTVGGSRGSADTPRDVRGFAVKFYTSEGNYDFVGNNMPVFFIQDAIKFPDFVHAVKPEPHNEIPQASSAHDSLWDFVSLTLESSHMMMWLMSDRALPRSYAMMEGFGIHTFRLINAKNQARYVKFHWKPLLGTHSLVWDEAQKLAGKDPDFNRRDLFERIEKGNFPEWELGLQVFGDAEADAFGFDILDATKLIPEELVPVRRVGKMVLDRNPDNYFAETEQVAFCTSHLVPGIGFTNDPLLQGRNFSYLDTQLSRLGGPNFHEIPINRPVCPFSNHQRDGLHRMTIDTGDANYSPNSLDENIPFAVDAEAGGFATYPARVDGVMRRVRSASFDDHFSQATLFWNSMSDVEKEHLVGAFSFELAKVTRSEIRERVLNEMLVKIDVGLARAVAENVGLVVADGARNGNGSKRSAKNGSPSSSPLLSMLDPRTGVPGDLTGRKVAVLVGAGSDAHDVTAMRDALAEAGAEGLVLAEKLGTVKAPGGRIEVDHTLVTMPSVAFDAVYVAAGSDGRALAASGDVVNFVAEAYKHLKPIALSGDADGVLDRAGIATPPAAEDGVLLGDADEVADAFVELIGRHRVWTRGNLAAVPA